MLDLEKLKQDFADGRAVNRRTDKGRLSPEQSAFLEAMNTAGYHAVMCRGWEQAAETILDYLGKEML